MAQLLHIDVSPREARSHSRALSREFVEIWLASHPNDRVVYRDIGHHPPPHVDEAWIAAAFTSPAQRTPAMQSALRTSDMLVDELLTADILVIGTPMYNFGVPSNFKAYIDQIIRLGRTFDFDPHNLQQPYSPRLANKRAYIIVATGDVGYETGGRLAHYNHLDPHLQTLFGFIGITDLSFVHTGNDEFGGDKLKHSLHRAQTEIASLVGIT